MSERALRRALALYGQMGATYLADQLWTSYTKQMRTISAKAWEPAPSTLEDLRAALAQTNAYRFHAQEMPPFAPESDPEPA